MNSYILVISKNKNWKNFTNLLNFLFWKTIFHISIDTIKNHDFFGWEFWSKNPPYGFFAPMSNLTKMFEQVDLDLTTLTKSFLLVFFTIFFDFFD
jgi:hypothetical protein